MSYTMMKNVDPVSLVRENNEIREFADFEQAFDQVVERLVSYGYIECVPTGGYKLTSAGKACLLAPENNGEE